ncbi:hypothetical protein BDV18DRAFT_86521 [Aspergillus unguis]
MEHVSTLCAISTVGIAATGFALGRVERAQSLEPTNTQHAPLLHDETNTSLNARQRQSRTIATADTQSPVNPNLSGHRENATPYTDQLEDGNAPRKTSFAGIRFRRRGQTLTLPPLRLEDNPPASSHGRRPSSSWIRRLSFQPDKRFSLQSPDSPSFPEPASPASPAFSRPSSQRRAPNKLVKRPKSQHSNASPLFSPTVTSPLAPSALRRPATSYQRSETFKHKPTHSLSFEPSLALGPLLEPASGNVPLENDSWRPYLVASSDASPERLDRRFSTATKIREPPVKRISPQTDIAPALLLGTSITKQKSPAKSASNEPSKTPLVEFRDPFKSDGASPQQLSISSSLDQETCQPPLEETCPKSPAEDMGPLDMREFRNGSFTGPKRRAVSTPLPDVPSVEGAIWVSSRAPERRNITDPSIFRRPPNNSTNAGLADLFSSGIMGSQSKYRKDFNAGLGQNRHRETGRCVSTDGSALSSIYGSIRQRPKRHSIAASDPASTIIGSDDTRVFTSGDEDETDFMSDTAFDSIRTHITTDSLCLQPPRIESIFDKAIVPSMSNEPFAKPDGIILPKPQPLPPTKSHGVDLKEAALPSVPVTQNLTDDHEGDTEVSFPSDLSEDDDTHSMVASLPGDKTIRPSLTLAKFGALSVENTESQQELPAAHGIKDVDFAMKESTHLESDAILGEIHETSPRMNIFDWSEQSKPDREGSGPDGRPRTVHGKQGPGMRGSRASGRKPPSALHYRSQSVPVAREPTVPNESRQTSGKFGTWGLGSKGVSEDWDSDFEFEDNKDKDDNTMNENINPKKHVSRPSVIVPQAIMERQASLHGQFGQVQELTLLVEELKRLRHQASFLDLIRGPSNELWKEAEGIVDLATLDDEDNSHSPPRSPSLTFSFDESEGDSSQLNDPWQRVSGDSWRASISENSSSRPTTSPCPDQTAATTKTHSVLDLIYQQRLSHDPPTLNSQPPRSKKLPFDTQSLRDLVVRAGVVTRALKEVVRKAEGVTNGSEENMHPSHPAFSRIFEHPSHDDLSKFETTCIS